MRLPSPHGKSVVRDGVNTGGSGDATLDGLGAVGGGAHADHEHVLVDSLPGRAALLAALIERSSLTEEAAYEARTCSTRPTRPPPGRPGRPGSRIRELDSLAELDAMVGLFDEIWEPDGGNHSMQRRPAAGADQGGQLRRRRLRPGERRAARRVHRVLRAAGARGAAQPHRRGAARRARPVGRVRAQGAPAGVVPAPRRAA